MRRKCDKMQLKQLVTEATFKGHSLGRATQFLKCRCRLCDVNALSLTISQAKRCGGNERERGAEKTNGKLIFLSCSHESSSNFSSLLIDNSLFTSSVFLFIYLFIIFIYFVWVTESEITSISAGSFLCLGV